jgi:hypothetical protein
MRGKIAKVGISVVRILSIEGGPQRNPVSAYGSGYQAVEYGAARNGRVEQSGFFDEGCQKDVNIVKICKLI